MGNSIYFWHMNGCSCESVKVFETENVSSWGGVKPLTFGFMPNALTIWAIRARHLLFHVFEYWYWWYRYFWSKVDIWNVNYSCQSVKGFQTENVWTWWCKFSWKKRISLCSQYHVYRWPGNERRQDISCYDTDPIHLFGAKPWPESMLIYGQSHT